MIIAALSFWISLETDNATLARLTLRLDVEWIL